MWVDGEKTDMLIKRDDAYLETLGKSFKVPLDIYNFDTGKRYKFLFTFITSFIYFSLS